MSDNGEWKLALAFDRDDPEFARGVEVGMVMQRLAVEGAPMTATMHVSNAEMAMRLAEAGGVIVTAEDLGDWLLVRFDEAES